VTRGLPAFCARGRRARTRTIWGASIVSQADEGSLTLGNQASGATTTMAQADALGAAI
jgi:hypothetical protein